MKNKIISVLCAIAGGAFALGLIALAIWFEMQTFKIRFGLKIIGAVLTVISIVVMYVWCMLKD